MHVFVKQFLCWRFSGMPGSINEGAGKGAENGSGCVIFF